MVEEGHALRDRAFIVLLLMVGAGAVGSGLFQLFVLNTPTPAALFDSVLGVAILIVTWLFLAPHVLATSDAPSVPSSRPLHRPYLRYPLPDEASLSVSAAPLAPPPPPGESSIRSPQGRIASGPVEDELRPPSARRSRTPARTSAAPVGIGMRTESFEEIDHSAPVDEPPLSLDRVLHELDQISLELEPPADSGVEDPRPEVRPWDENPESDPFADLQPQTDSTVRFRGKPKPSGGTG